MIKPLVMLLAGGGGTRLGPLVKHRAKPAVPFMGHYRIIDFALSNVMHAQLDWVGVLTQYKPLSLMRHLGVGGSWNLRGRRRGVRILPPRTGDKASDWYRGTADAIWQNLDFMRAMNPQRVLILSGDHIYRMDYQQMVEQHVNRRADLSIAVMKVPQSDVSRFGMVWLGPGGTIEKFEEKPKQADTQLASMGIYLFEWDCLNKALEEVVATRKGYDFGFDIMSCLLEKYRVVAHPFDGYWRDVGTISSYYSANMDALQQHAGICIDDWQICTRDESNPLGDRVPTRFGSAAETSQALISAGCDIQGAVHNSILSTDVTIAPGATVEDSILMEGVHIDHDAHIKKVIVDKFTRIGAGASIKAGDDSEVNQEFGKCELAGMTVLGKSVSVPPGLRIGSNVVVEANVSKEDFPNQVPSGTTISALSRT